MASMLLRFPLRKGSEPQSRTDASPYCGNHNPTPRLLTMECKVKAQYSLAGKQAQDMLMQVDLRAFFPQIVRHVETIPRPAIDVIVILDLPSATMGRNRIRLAKAVAVEIIETLQDNTRVSILTTTKGLDRNRLLICKASVTSGSKSVIAGRIRSINTDIPAPETDCLATVLQTVDSLRASPRERKVGSAIWNGILLTMAG